MASADAPPPRAFAVDGAVGYAMWVERSVRSAVDDVGREVAQASASSGGAGRRLEAAWSRLVGVLALGPAPELRACPYCGGEGMRAATRCGSCWEPLTPPPASAPARGGA